MNPRVQGLYPSTQDLREAGHLRDRNHADAGALQLAEGASRRENLDPELAQTPREIGEITFVEALIKSAF